MNRIYKPFLLATFLLLFTAFTSTSLGQTFSLTVNNTTVSETAGIGATLTISANNGSLTAFGAIVGITYTGTAANGTDYTAGGAITLQTQLFKNATGILTITIADDLLFEGDETIIATITSVTGGNGSPTISGTTFSTTITITDAERISLVRGTSQVNEASVVSYFAEVRDNGGGTINGATVAKGTVTVNVDWSTGTADPTADFSGEGDITITNGTSSGFVAITATDDSFLEGDETLIGKITAITYGTIGTNTDQTIIKDGESLIFTGGITVNEAVGAVSLSATISGGGSLKLNGGGGLSLTVTYTGTATYLTDFTNLGAGNPHTFSLGNNALAVFFGFNPVNDATIELDETVIATLTTTVPGITITGSPQTTTITDDIETVLTSPADAAPSQALNVALTWDAVAGADQYKLYVNTSNGFGSGTAILDGVDQGNVTSFAPGGLSDNIEYFWKVVPRNTSTGDTRAASDTEFRSFTTTQQSAGTFPLDNAVGVELFPTLTWPTGPTGTDTYRLEVNTASNFGGTVIYDNATLTSTSQQIAGLSNVTEYFWRVTASSNLQKVNSSTVFSFTTSTDKYVTLSYPVSGTTVATLVPTLSWSVSNSVSGLTYEYQVSSTNSFTDTSPTPIAASATSVTSATLSGGTTYYWRVRSKTSGGLYSQWSSVGTFATQSGLTAAPVPTISWPTGNPTLYDTTPTLYWYLSSVPPSGASLDFDIEVELVGDAFDGTPTYSGKGSATVTNFAVTTPLVPGSSYHWQVRTNNTTASVTSAYSSEGTFNISIGQGGAPPPVLSWPISGVTVYTITPTLYWYLSTPATGTVTYDIDVDDDSNFGSVNFNSSAQSAQSVLVNPGTPLSSGTTYYWQVKTHNGGNSSSFVTTNGSFVIASTIASAPDPVLSFPISGTTVYSNKPTLYWYLSGIPPTGETITYDINVDNNTDFGSVTDSKTGNTTQSYTVTTALDPGTYYWQVKVNNTTASSTSGFLPATGTSANSFVVSSTASGVAVTPTPLYPTGNATVSSLTPTLSWFVSGVLAGDETYSVELKPTSLAFDGTGLVTGISSQSTTTVTLASGTAYRWRVQSVSATNGTSSFSAEALFTTAATLAPPPPMGGGPLNGAMIANGQPDISWFLPTAPKTALMYRLQISEDANMSNIAFELDDIDAFHTVVNSLKGGTVYYWRVQSRDDKGVYSAHSKVSRFVTGSVTAVDNELVIPQKFTLEQNYPNPFNPATIIRFALPEASFVILKIYNMLGQEVKTLVSGQKNAGTYNVQWRGDNDLGQKVSSGTYIYRVIAGQNIFTKKMILLK